MIMKGSLAEPGLLTVTPPPPPGLSYVSSGRPALVGPLNECIAQTERTG